MTETTGAGRSTSDDPMTRLWERADASHGHHVEAVEALRERKRREHEPPRRIRRGRRDGKRDAADPTQQPTEAPEARKQVACERCRRTVERASTERLEIPSRGGEPTAHLMCARCADEVRSGLLRLLAGAEPLPVSARVPNQEAQEEQALPPSTPTRVGSFLVPVIAYPLIALAVFGVVSWILAH